MVNYVDQDNLAKHYLTFSRQHTIVWKFSKTKIVSCLRYRKDGNRSLSFMYKDNKSK